MTDFFLHSFFIELLYKIQEIVIGSYFVEHHFLTLGALVLNHISLILPMIYIDRLHLSMTLTCSIPGARIVHMFGAETEGTVISG
jgi:hypothetical protein